MKQTGSGWSNSGDVAMFREHGPQGPGSKLDQGKLSEESQRHVLLQAAKWRVLPKDMDKDLNAMTCFYDVWGVGNFLPEFDFVFFPNCLWKKWFAKSSRSFQMVLSSTKIGYYPPIPMDYDQSFRIKIAIWMVHPILSDRSRCLWNILKAYQYRVYFVGDFLY